MKSTGSAEWTEVYLVKAVQILNVGAKSEISGLAEWS